MCRGIGQRIDNLHLLDDRAGPSVRDDERQRVVVLRTHVNEMNVQPIDLGDELRHGVQRRFARAPVILRCPIARECLHRRELYSLGCVCNRLSFRPSRRLDATAQFGQFRFRNVDAKRANRGLVSCRLAGLLGHTGRGHVSSSSSLWPPDPIRESVTSYRSECSALRYFVTGISQSSYSATSGRSHDDSC